MLHWSVSCNTTMTLPDHITIMPFAKQNTVYTQNNDIGALSNQLKLMLMKTNNYTSQQWQEWWWWFYTRWESSSLDTGNSLSGCHSYTVPVNGKWSFRIAQSFPCCQGVHMVKALSLDSGLRHNIGVPMSGRRLRSAAMTSERDH